ncbi:hypothetical protein GPECTOR_55g288 [Gonium pectorale]|uniref:Methyltransferase domain-containing protein n=1 Tax=Gonium pectorale TaxID=33097 RepID=A0A150G6A9_GONPE|nr:hypothetical protein GPECTOR_55g288 [Gonium pectorale]|eukprot:KXZ45382.1 hypothetical protein GPECTOR_55g288 [Gonium pectorale]
MPKLVTFLAVLLALAVRFSSASTDGQVPLRVLYHNNEWALRAAHNLSQWRSRLFESTEQWMVSMNNNERPERWDRFKLFQPFISCPPERPLRRVGPLNDGGKWLCEPAREVAPCTIISMGSNMDFRFEEAVLNETVCNVATLDCTVDGRVLGDRHKFFKVCVGNSRHAAREPGRVVTYSQLLQQLGLQSLAILKIDVEGYEFPVFAEWHETTRGLPEQISVEVHWHKVWGAQGTPEELFPQWGRPDMSAMDLSLFFFHLANLGYGIVSQEINDACPTCSEFTFLRVEGPYSHRLNPPPA